MNKIIKSYDNLIISDPPHIKDKRSVKQIMWLTAAALLPANIYSVHISGVNTLIIICASVASAVIAEALYKILLKKPITVSDGSAVITGLLVAMNMPSAIPFWIPAVCSFFAIIIAKQLFGGLGFNIFNPAAAALAFAYTFRPDEMSAGTGNIMKVIARDWPSYDNVLQSIITGNYGPYIGESSALLILAGAGFLLFKRIITWHIPAAFIGTAVIFMMLYYFITGFYYPVAASFLQMFSGGFIIYALFMATDTVTSPITKKGMIIFGAGCGILASVLRLCSDTGAVCFAVLLMNAAVPLIDKYSAPRVFGKNV